MAIRLSGMKDAEVARKADVDADWLAGVKSRTRPNKNPDPKRLRRLAAVLDVPYRWFAAALDWTDESENPKEAWEVLLLDDDRLTDEGRQSLRRQIKLEFEAAERERQNEKEKPTPERSAKHRVG